jgi:hypothetical protein
MTGAADNKALLLGKKPTFGEEAAQVLETGLGAGIARGAGEAAATGFKALARAFGPKAPDIAAAAIAKEAEDVVGPSPYGDSRVAQGLHHAEILDAIGRDVPLTMPGAAPAADNPNFSIAALASPENDAIFAGKSQPLSSIFDVIPQHIIPTLAAANTAINRLTERVQRASDFAAELAAKVQGEDVAPDLIKQRLDIVGQRIAENPPKRKLGQLLKQKADLEDRLGVAEARANDMKALASQAQFAARRADDLRLKRAQLVMEAARRVPGARSSTIAQKLAASAGGANIPPINRRVTRPLADEAEAVVAAPVAEPRQPKIIPAPEPVEGEAPRPAAGETVDVGQHGDPVPLDHEVVVGVDEDGKPVRATIRDVLQGHAEDDALIANMKSCLIE